MASKLLSDVDDSAVSIILLMVLLLTCLSENKRFSTDSIFFTINSFVKQSHISNSLICSIIQMLYITENVLSCLIETSKTTFCYLTSEMPH